MIQFWQSSHPGSSPHQAKVYTTLEGSPIFQSQFLRSGGGGGEGWDITMKRGRYRNQNLYPLYVLKCISQDRWMLPMDRKQSKDELSILKTSLSFSKNSYLDLKANVTKNSMCHVQMLKSYLLVSCMELCAGIMANNGFQTQKLDKDKQ